MNTRIIAIAAAALAVVAILAVAVTAGNDRSNGFCGAPAAAVVVSGPEAIGPLFDSRGETWPSRIITYSFAPDDGPVVPDTVGTPETNATEGNSLHRTMNARFGREQAWKNIIREAFREWESKTPLQFREVPDDGKPFFARDSRGQIRFFARSFDGAGGRRADAFPPRYGQIRFDNKEEWEKGDLLKKVTLHEIGHAIGLRHVCPRNSTKVMEDHLGIPVTLSEDEVRGIHFLYGDALEPGDASEVAITRDALIAADLSLRHRDGTSDVDRFVVKVDPESEVVLAVQPVGSQYSVAAETLQCTGSPTDASRQLPLRLSAVGASGEEIIRIADLGKSAEIAVTVPANGQLRLRIEAAVTPASNTVQQYRIRLR
jgi:hypothetical protein